MVNTTLPANIGSAARAMHTMGLSHLHLVAPKHPIDDSSHAHAAGAGTLLDNAQHWQQLTDALVDCQLVFAASSRSRHLPRPVVTPTQAAAIMAEFVDAQSKVSAKSIPTKIALVFGREDRGLTNDELALADYHIQIDANPAYPVLNVAAAVQVIASFIYAHISQISQTNTPACDAATHTAANTSCSSMLPIYLRQHWDEPAINHAQSQQLSQQLIKLMLHLDLANSDDLRQLPMRLSRLGSRLQLDIKEYQLLNAIINKLLLK